jgi:O-antigen/teichoic acid export membrane protein
MSAPGIRQSSAIGAALLVTGSTYISFMLGLLASALAARALGPHDFGRYAYVVWLSGVLVVVANNGLTTTAIRFISELRGAGRGSDVDAIHGWLWKRQVACSVGTIVLLTACLSLLKPSDWTESLAIFGIVVAVSVFAKSMYLFDVSAAKGHRQFGVEATSSVALSVLNALAVLALFLLHLGLLSYLAVFAAVSVGYAVAGRILLSRRGIVSTAGPIGDELRQRVGQHLFWTVVLCLIAAFGSRATETYLLNRLWTAADVGFFAIAVAICRGGAEILSSGLTSVLMPLMAQGYGEQGLDRVKSILAASVRYFTFAGLVLAGVGTLWAESLVTLIYGDQYAAAVPVFQVMVIATGLTLSQGAFGAVLSTTDNQRLRAAAAAILVTLAAGLALLLVPPYGLRGATASVALGAVITLAVVALMVTRTVGATLPWRELSRLLAAAAAAFAVVALCAYVLPHPLVRFVLGVAYVWLLTMASVRFGAWTSEDFRMMSEFANRKPRQLGWLARWIERSQRGGEQV